MIYYAPTIFGQLGMSGNTTSLLATGVYGIVNCLSTLPALFFIDKVGRRALLMAGATGTCISLAIVGGILGGYGSTLAVHRSAGWCAIAFIYIYDINFSYSFGEYSDLLCENIADNFNQPLSVGFFPLKSSIFRSGPRLSLSRPRPPGCVTCKSFHGVISHCEINLRSSLIPSPVSSALSPQACSTKSPGGPTSSSQPSVFWHWPLRSSAFQRPVARYVSCILQNRVLTSNY